MESVRFSIIENELRWEDQQSDDEIEISSESSGGGVPTASPQTPCVRRFFHEIWKKNEILKSMENLPHYEAVVQLMHKENIAAIGNRKNYLGTALLLSTWKRNGNAVTTLLDTYNADPNICDEIGRTPLHLACYIGDPAIARTLIRKNAQVHVWDITEHITPLHCAACAASLECVQLLIRNGAQLNAAIEKRSVLHYAVENNAVQCVQLLLSSGAVPNTPQVFTETPLHVAAALGHQVCIRLLIAGGADVRSQFGPKKLTALHLAVEENYSECVKVLLEAGANINAKNSDCQTPLHLACLYQSSECVDILIRKGADVHSVYKDGRTALHAAIVKESKDWECAKLLLISGIDVNKADNYGYTPLHMAALNEFGSCAYLLIENGADITSRTNGGISALAFIVRRTPEIIPKYVGKFDAAIKVNDNEIGDVDCEIKLDFRILVPNTERGETELLLTFIEVGQKRILKHPLCETFLFLKWRRIRKFFLFGLFFNAVFVLLFTFFVMGVYVKDCPKLNKMPTPCASPTYIKAIGYTVVFLNCIVLGKELFQMAHGFIGYIKYWENWLQGIIIFSVFLCALTEPLLTDDLTSIPKWKHHVAAIVIFLVWLELMMMVGRFPIFGLYIQMFTKVSVNFSKFLLAYSCLLVAFGLSFGVLFSNYKSFKFVPWSILKTIIMMAGELEFEDIFYGDSIIYYPGTSHLIFFAFVLLITVILTNLLVGLAVSDITGLQASAGLDRLLRQAELVSRLEGLFYSKILTKAPKKLIGICQRTALLRTSRCRLQFCVKPNDPRERRLPKDLIVSIYKLVAERRDRNQSIRRRKSSTNYSFFKRKINKELSEDIELRRGGNPNLRFRTISENPKSFSKLPNINLENETLNHSEVNKLDQLILKIERNQKSLVKKLDDVVRDINSIKLQLNHN